MGRSMTHICSATCCSPRDQLLNFSQAAPKGQRVCLDLASPDAVDPEDSAGRLQAADEVLATRGMAAPVVGEHQQRS